MGYISDQTPSDDLIDLSYDHTDPDWVSRAYSDWGGLVRDMAHGVRELNLPIETGDLMDLIKPGDTIDPASSSESQSLKNSRFYWKAELRILDGYPISEGATPIDRIGIIPIIGEKGNRIT